MHLLLRTTVLAVVLALPAWAQPLPEGDTGIASRYPGDVGIAADSQVIFADDFEGYSSGAQLGTRWNAGVYHNASITTAPANVFRGAKALEFLSPQQAAELSNGVARAVSPELDVLFLRFASKFDTTFDVLGSSHNGGGISAHYFVNGNATPGVPADGTNKYLVEYECWRGEAATANPGDLNLYIYHPEQRSQWGDHFFPDGAVMPNTSLPGNFGPTFVARPKIIPQRGRWYTYELMLKANTPGQRDGRVALWLDGALIADFPNLRLRDIATLKIDRFNLSLHIGSNTVAETRKWYDNVVAATAYVGPVFAGGVDAGTSADAGPSTDAGPGADAGNPADGGADGPGGGLASDAGALADAGAPGDGGAGRDGGGGPGDVAGGCGCEGGGAGPWAVLGALVLAHAWRRRRRLA